MTRTTLLATCAALLAMSAISVSAQGTKTYKARLAPVPMDASMAATVSGLGSATATLTGTTLTVSGTFDGLKSPATIAQIRKAQRGVRGPVLFDLKVTPNGMGGTISGSVTLTPQQVTDLDKAWFYIQLHSEKAPDGNLWGWLLPLENKR
jgi:hypothetical protein